jgi:hypothetical protein
VDPSQWTDFLNLLQHGRESLGQTGQFYTGAARQLAAQTGQSVEDASKLLNSGMLAADRQVSSAMGAYSDSDATSKILGVAKSFGIDPAKASAKFMEKLGPGFGNIEDMGSRANAVAGVGDIAQRQALLALASGDPSDPMTQFARYLLGGPAPATPTEKL